MRIREGERRADEARAKGASVVAATSPDGTPRERTVVVGDPQAPLAKFLEVLDRHGLLGDHGRIVPSVRVVSIGDHFDWGKPEDRVRATEDGTRLLAYLASHPPDQVVMLLGNHDLARVGELEGLDDETFLAMRDEADRIYRGEDTADADDRAFIQKHPRFPSCEVVSRDFSCFAAHQREWVTALLRARRFRIAHAEGGILCQHAGVTSRYLSRVGLPEADHADAEKAASALNRYLDERVAAWRGGVLELPAIHQHGSCDGGEAGGLFFHRPAVRNEASDDEWSWTGDTPRRFDPRTVPAGLFQVVGHIRDGKCRKLLAPHLDTSEPALDGPLRSLSVEGEDLHYGRGVFPYWVGQALIVFADGGMNYTDLQGYEVFDLSARTAAPRVR